MHDSLHLEYTPWMGTEAARTRSIAAPPKRDSMESREEELLRVSPARDKRPRLEEEDEDDLELRG